LVPVSGLQASEDEKKMKKYDAKRDFGLKIWKIEEKCLNLQRSVLVVPEVIQTIRCFFFICCTMVYSEFGVRGTGTEVNPKVWTD